MREQLIYSAPLKDVGNLAHHSLKLTQGDHLCQFYHNDLMLMEALSHFVVPSLTRGDGIIIIATEKNRKMFEAYLTKRAIDVPKALAHEQLIMLDAHATLETFMVDGIPNRDLFRENIIPVIQKMRSKYPIVRAYGEMVNILFHAHNYLATRQLEDLWNDLARTEPFSLMCGYSLSEKEHEKYSHRLEEICSTPTHLISNYGTLFTRH